MLDELDKALIEQTIPKTGTFPENTQFLEAATVEAEEPANRSLALDGYLWWNNIPVCYEGGARLFVNGSPLRAKQVQFYIDDLKWQYSTNGFINDPWGNGQPASADWLVPGMLQFGILLFQPGVAWARVDRGINNQAIQSPGQDIYIGVNDKKGTYGDNGGAFDLYLKILS